MRLTQAGRRKVLRGWKQESEIAVIGSEIVPIAAAERKRCQSSQSRVSSLLQGHVIVADDPRDPPDAVFVLPEVNELRFAGCLDPHFRLVEAMNPRLNRAIAVHRMNLERSGDQFPAHFAADVLFDLVGHGLAAYGESSFIVIELHIVRKERFELFDIAPVIGSRSEQLAVQRRDGLEKFIRNCRAP